jgi:predicted anti-sigma-YlaC factor YlaD
MSDQGCHETRNRLALGEANGEGESVSSPLAEHLSECEDCRREAESLKVLFEHVRRTAESEPPEDLDREIRKRIGEFSPRRQPLLRPLPAVALAVVAMLSVGIGLVFGLTNTTLAEGAPVVVIILLFIYFAVSLTAMLPVLVQRKSFMSRAWSVPGVTQSTRQL